MDESNTTVNTTVVQQTRRHIHEVWSVVSGILVAAVLIAVVSVTAASCIARQDNAQTKQVTACANAGGQWISNNCVTSGK